MVVLHVPPAVSHPQPLLPLVAYDKLYLFYGDCCFKSIHGVALLERSIDMYLSHV